MTLTKEKNITPTKKNHDNDLKISKLPLLHLEKCPSILIAISLLFSWNSKEMSQIIKKHNHKINKKYLVYISNCYVMTNCDNIVGGFAKNDFPLRLLLYIFITIHNTVNTFWIFTLWVRNAMFHNHNHLYESPCLQS